MQKNSNLHLNQDKIVRAIAGAGKTTKLIDDVYDTYLSHKKEYERSPRILLTTFTVKAANELSERLFDKAIQIGDKEFLSYCLSSYLEIGTMHSIFSSLLNQLDQNFSQNTYVSYSYKLNCAKGFFTKAIEEKKVINLFSESYDFNETLKFFLFLEKSSFDYSLFDKMEILEGVKNIALASVDTELTANIKNVSSFSEFEGLISKLNPETDKDLITLLKRETNKEYFIKKFYSHNEKIKDLYHEWFKEFSEFVKNKNLYTLEDMESLVLKISKEQKLSLRWNYCFFDEYQDTSPEQKELIERFCNQSIRYFVGDPFQSIYFFRGARKEIFDNEFNRIKNEDLSVEYKTTNYRSSKDIVHFINHISNKMFLDFDNMTPNKSENGKVRVAFFENQTIDDEIDFLLSELENLNPKDVLILSRQTKKLSKAFKELKLRGFSALPLYGSGVSDHLKSFELINFIQFIDDQKNENALKVLIFSDMYDFSEEELAKCIETAKKNDQTLWQEIKEDERLSLLKSLTDDSRTYAQALRVFITESGFINQSHNNIKSSLKEFNSFKILQSLEEEEKKPGFNIKAFCDDLLFDRYPFGKESVEDSDSYKLMTVHGSKGLEAKHVFIIDANQGYKDLDNYPLFFDELSKNSAAKVKDKNQNRSFPLFYQALIDKEKRVKKEEHRRLLYVAMTRAKYDLCIIGSGKREKKPSEPSWMSHILNTLDESSLPFVDFVNAKSVRQVTVSKNLNKKVDFFKNRGCLSWDAKESEDIQKHPTKNLYKLSQNIKKGIDFHAYMEAGGKDKNEEYESALNYLKSQKEIPFSEIFEKGYREWGYDWLNPDTKKRESGKIDLWAEFEDIVWIVDYKTGSLSGVDKGFEQLKRYKRVLSDYLNNNKKIMLVLAFPFNKKILLKS